MSTFAMELERQLKIRLGYDGTTPCLGNNIIEAVTAARIACAVERRSTDYMVTTFEGHSEEEIRLAFRCLKWAKDCAVPVLKYYDAQNSGNWKRTMAQQVLTDAPKEIL